MPYPQYWAFRLSGVLASEVTSLGCHSDLLRPHWLTYSALANGHGWSYLFPPRRFAGETLGFVEESVAEVTGLSATCRVVCGIHDSNASYLRHLLTKRHSRFAVLSSGTWVVLMANKGDLSRLKPERDMLANVDAFGAAVATARFMGGREYEAIACTPVPGGVDELKRLMVQRAKALPAFALGGPFAHSPGRLVNAHALSETERASLATLYLALMSDLLMESLGVEGDVILDGPLADDPLFGSVLARLRPANRICAEQAGGAASAVCYLAGYPLEKGPALREIRPAAVDRLDRYRMRWREELPKLPSAARQLAS